jgi:hypothetical protein
MLHRYNNFLFALKKVLEKFNSTRIHMKTKKEELFDGNESQL